MRINRYCLTWAPAKLLASPRADAHRQDLTFDTSSGSNSSLASPPLDSDADHDAAVDRPVTTLCAHDTGGGSTHSDPQCHKYDQLSQSDDHEDAQSDGSFYSPFDDEKCDSEYGGDDDIFGLTPAQMAADDRRAATIDVAPQSHQKSATTPSSSI